jgi:ribosomal protein S6
MESESNQKDYELTFLLKDETELGEVLNVLRQHDAVVAFESPVKKIALAYEIAKQTSALFGFVRFSVLPGRVLEIDRAMTLHHSVLRFLIVQFILGKAVPTFQASMSPTIPLKSATPEAPAQGGAQSTSNVHSLPLSNEDLEKKIEEILK